MHHRCNHCGSVLSDRGRCPGTQPIPRDHNGVEHGTAAQIAHRLGRDVTTHMVRNWAARDGLPRVRGHDAAGRPEVRYPVPVAVNIEAAKRLAQRGRHRARAAA